MNVAVVVPTIREDCAQRFLAEWKDDLDGARVIVTEDNPDHTFTLPAGVEHYSWADIDRDLGSRARIIPRRSSAIRSYGLWKARQGGADVIWTLDDDCYPEKQRRGSYLDFIAAALGAQADDDSWYNTIGDPDAGVYPRGYPYGIRGATRQVMVHHGIWSEVPDLDGLTQQAVPYFRMPPARTARFVPSGALFPMCGMNLAFRAEMTPAMYFMLMGQDGAGQPWGLDRFDDIWTGLMVKRICDHLGYAVSSGAPSVRHSRASDPVVNAAKEAPGLAAHEELWPVIAKVPLTAGDVAGCYRELARAVAGLAIPVPRAGYWQALAMAMTEWAGLFT